jgi:hypothetical protein
MKYKPTTSRLLKQVDQVISVWGAHPDFNVGSEVTLQRLKDLRGQLAASTARIQDLKRQLIEQTHVRDDQAQACNELVVRTRKGILAFFGPDSTQYAQVGGTRASERKTPVRRSKPLPLAEAA